MNGKLYVKRGGGVGGWWRVSVRRFYANNLLRK